MIHLYSYLSLIPADKYYIEIKGSVREKWKGV